MGTTTVMELHSAGETPRPRFDYRGRHRYLITLETTTGAAVFTMKERVLQVLTILHEESSHKHFDVHAYCFLPTRLLLLIQGKNDEAHMKTFLSAFRARSSAEMQPVLGRSLWKRTYRERVLRKTEETRVAARDLLQTPVRERLAAAADVYEFQGSFVAPVFRRPRAESAVQKGSRGRIMSKGKRVGGVRSAPRRTWKTKKRG